MWLTCFDSLQQWNQTHTLKHSVCRVSIHIVFLKQNKLITKTEFLQNEVFCLMDMICEGDNGKQ